MRSDAWLLLVYRNWRGERNGKAQEARIRESKRAVLEMKRGELRSGRSGKKVSRRKQAIAIGLSEGRRDGAKAPARKVGGRSQ